MFTDDYLIRVRVFDADVVVCNRNCDRVWSLLKEANHVKVTTTEGDVWITAATSHAGPSDLDDPDVRCSVPSAPFSGLSQPNPCNPTRIHPLQEKIMTINASDLGDYSKVFAASPEGIAIVGGLWVAQYGSELPDDVDTDLSTLTGPDGTTTDVYTNLGYISSDGSTLKIDGKTKPIEIWSGREIGSMRDGFPVSLSMKLLQVLDPKVNATVFGADAVSTTAATQSKGARMKLEISSKLPDRVTLVLDSFFEAKSLRQIFEIAQVDELGDIKEVHNEVMAYEPTFKVFPGSTGKNVIRYSDDGVVDPASATP